MEASLAKLKAAASGAENIMPALIECASAYATLGEMCDVLKGIFGTQGDSNLF